MATKLLTRVRNAWRGWSGQLLDATRRGEDSFAPDWQRHPRDIMADVPYYDYRALIAYSRRLFANLDVLKYASDQKAMHAIGSAWTPVFLGEDKEWGDAATHWLKHEWFKCCDIRGRDSFHRLLHLDSNAIDHDGENDMILTEAEDGYPLTQRIPCHRIGQYNFGPSEVGDEAETYVNGEWVKGAYKGLRIEQGIIYNRVGRMVARRIIGDLAYSETPQDISVRDIDVCGEAEYVDQGRCFPAISASINFFASYLKAHGYEQQALEIASSIALTERNATGGADTSDPSVINSHHNGVECDPNRRRLIIERHAGGSVRYFRSDDPGAGVEAFANASRPGAPWESFSDRVMRSVGSIWPYQLAWKPESLNGTQDRAIIEAARAMVKARQNLLMPRAVRSVGYAVSKAIKLGILPPYPGDDVCGFLKWSFEMPPEFSIDHGREDSQFLEMYRAGLVSEQQYLDQSGRGSYEALVEQRCKAAAIRQKVRKRVELAEGVQIDPREIIMLTPNDQPAGDPNATDENQNTPAPNKPAAADQDAPEAKKKVEPTCDGGKFEESKHPRKDDGEFGEGGGGTKKGTEKQGDKPGKSDTAKKAAVHVGRDIQQYADTSEATAAKKVGGVSFKDSEPVDIVTGKNGVVQHGIEFKCVVLGADDKLTMNSYAQVRKIEWEKKNKATFHTLVFDDRKVYSADGKHAESKREIYYRRGVAGSARLGSLYKCKDIDEARALMAMDEKKLPEGAQRTDAHLRQGSWKFFQDAQGKGYSNKKTGQVFRAKK